MGCLRAMVVRIGCLVILLALLVAGFLYRREVLDYYRAWRGGAGATWTAPAADASRAHEVLRRLEQRGGPAYEDLSAADLAALVTAALQRQGRHAMDSVQVALLENEVRVRGILDLSGVPRHLLGPLASMVGDHEPAAIGGPLSVDTAGRLLLTVTYLRLRDFPFPRATIPRLLGAAHLPGVDGATMPLPVSARLGDVRVSPAGVRFYRASPR
jgi:hypothetical protein